MRLVERAADLAGNLQRLVELERAPLETRCQSFTFEILHDEEAVSYVGDGAGVRVHELGDDASLAFESLAELGVAGDRLGEDFQGNVRFRRVSRARYTSPGWIDQPCS